MTTLAFDELTDLFCIHIFSVFFYFTYIYQNFQRIWLFTHKNLCLQNSESIFPVVLRIYVKRIQSNLSVKVPFVMFRKLKNKKEAKSSISISLSFTV